MKKAALLAAVAAGVAAGAALGVFVPRWLAPAATPVAAAAPAKPVSKPAPVRVEVSAVAEIPFARGLSAVGSLRSDEAVMLRPEVAGRIQSIDFKEGQPVKRGQALIRLDDSVPRAELAQARANLALAQSHYRRAVALQALSLIHI